MKNIMPKETKEMESSETPEKETKDYQAIDDFLASLDEDEMAYLKDCISKMGNDENAAEDKMLSAGDLEDDDEHRL